VVVDARNSDDPKAAVEEAGALLGKLKDIASVREAAFNQAGDLALIGAIPNSAPTGQATKDLVTAIRGQSATLQKDTGAGLMVTGLTAVNIGVSANCRLRAAGRRSAGHRTRSGFPRIRRPEERLQGASRPRCDIRPARTRGLGVRGPHRGRGSGRQPDLAAPAQPGKPWRRLTVRRPRVAGAARRRPHHRPGPVCGAGV
jgi:hypothetical protein